MPPRAVHTLAYREPFVRHSTHQQYEGMRISTELRQYITNVPNFKRLQSFELKSNVTTLHLFYRVNHVLHALSLAETQDGDSLCS